jgi:hypothetical protein
MRPMPAQSWVVRVRRDGAVDYVHKAMGRLMLGGPESVKVIDLREASDLTEARSN